MIKQNTITTQVWFMQVTAENLEPLSERIHGSIKGIKLPPEEREIHFWNKGIEYEAKVNDYIMTIGYFRCVINPEHYALIMDTHP